MIIDGKLIAEQIQMEIKRKVEACKGRKPALGVILVGNNPASQIYVKRKVEACEKVGIHSIVKKLPDNITEDQLTDELNAFNHDPSVDGILLQLPLPHHLNPLEIVQKISPEKDVDGLHPINAGKLLQGEKDGFVPCTPLGIQQLLVRSNIPIAGRHVVIVGRSNLVGKPIAALLMQNDIHANATVTLAHSKTTNLKAICQLADILIVAIGYPRFITAEMVKAGSTVIDVGINKIDKGIVGDVDYENVKNKAAHITPVPGGVGPMTIAMLLSNTLKSYLQRIEKGFS